MDFPMVLEETEYFELHTFTVRIFSCDAAKSPDNLTIRFRPRYNSNQYLEINGNQFSKETCIKLHRDSVNVEKSEVVYVNEHKVKVNHLGMDFCVEDGGYEEIAGVYVGKWECEEVIKRDLGTERDETTGYTIKMFPIGPNPEFIRSKVELHPSMEVELSGFCSDVPVKLKMSTRLDTDFFQFRLFYLRISGCDVDKAPNNLILRYMIQETWEYLEINGNKYSEDSPYYHPLTLHRAHTNIERSEVVYGSTDSVIINHYGVCCDIVVDNDNADETSIFHGFVARWAYDWTKESVHEVETDGRTGYFLNMCTSGRNGLEFVKINPNKVKDVKPCFEVFVAGSRCSTLPVALSVSGQFD